MKRALATHRVAARRNRRRRDPGCRRAGPEPQWSRASDAVLDGHQLRAHIGDLLGVALKLHRLRPALHQLDRGSSIHRKHQEEPGGKEAEHRAAAVAARSCADRERGLRDSGGGQDSGHKAKLPSGRELQAAALRARVVRLSDAMYAARCQWCRSADPCAVAKESRSTCFQCPLPVRAC